MAMTNSTIRFNTFNTRRNLPPRTGRKRGEELFVAAFERAHQREHSGIGGKQFALPGFGIADFVWAQPDNQMDNGFLLAAFEMKLSDWRRALHQAYRYSYFAHQAYVVLPTDYIATALGNLSMFEKLEVGLLQFDPASGTITRHCLPGRRIPRNQAAHQQAIGIWQRKLKFRQLLENAEALD